MSEVSFTILGSSSGMPQPDRACSGYLLQVGRSLNLIDCGSGVTASFLRCGFDPHALDRIFVSHSHSDHTSDLPLMIQMLHGLRTQRRLELFLPREFVKPFTDYLYACYLIPERLKLDLVIRGYDAGTLHDDRFHLRAIANTHHRALADDIRRFGLKHRLEAYSFLIQVDSVKLLYSADLGSLDDIKPYLDGLDVLIVETTHIDLDDLLERVRSAGIGKTVLTHLGDRFAVKELRRRIPGDNSDKIVLAADGMRLEL